MSRNQSRKFQIDLLWKNNTILGFVLGFICGLIIAVIIATIIMKTASPFNDANRQDRYQPEPAPSSITDPNTSLYGNRDLPKTIYKEALDQKEEKPENTLTYLQAGAYRDKNEAENRQAKLAFLGLESRIREVKTAKSPLYRVQLGPYTTSELAPVELKLKSNDIEYTTSRP